MVEFQGTSLLEKEVPKRETTFEDNVSFNHDMW
jgi:hypothetical protein